MIPAKELNTTQLVIVYQQSKNSEYYAEIYNQYFHKLYNFCFKRLGNHDDAYDATIDTFLKVSNKITSLKNPAAFNSWIFSIARNICTDIYRKKRKTVYTDTVQFDQIAEDDSDFLHQQLKESKLHQMKGMLTKLKPSIRVLILQKYIMGKSIKDLHLDTGLPIPTIKMRLFRGRRKMKQLMTYTAAS